MNTFTVKVGHLQAILLTAAKGDIRYYLNTILFEVQNGTLFLVSTDGHRLSYWRQPAPGVPDTQILIHREGLETVLKGLKVHQDLILALDDLVAVLPSGASLSGVLRKEDGRFPDWRRVVPTQAVNNVEGAKHTILDPDYLADLAKAAKLFANTAQRKRHDKMALRVWTYDVSGAALATVAGAPGYGAVIMPMTSRKPEAVAIAVAEGHLAGLPSTHGEAACP